MDISNTNKQYHSSAHLTYSCQYHVIFCPKYRRKVLVQGIDTRLKQMFIDISNQYSFSILEMEIMPDHVHLLIDCNPRFGIMECVKVLKRISAHNMREEFPALKSKIPSLWTRSVFISTVGTVSLDVVKKYIEDQKGK